MNRIPEFLSPRIPFFYGYLVAFLAVWALVCSSPGQTFAITAFTAPLGESLGLSRTQVAGAYMFGTIFAAIPLSLIGVLADRIGLQKTTALVALGLSLACGFMSAASGVVTLFVGFMLLRFLGQGALSLLPGNMVSMWFQTRLGRVNAAMAVGIAAAFGLMPSILTWSIEQIGWRYTYLAMGIVVAATLIPMMLLLFRNQPEDLGLRPDGLDEAEHKQAQSARPAEVSLTLAEAIRGRTLWILGFGMGIWALAGTGTIFFASEIFPEFGISKTRVQVLFGTFSIAMLATQISGGILADRLPLNRLMFFGFSLLAVGACVAPLTSTLWHMHLFALLFGAGQGLAIVTSSTLWVRYYGREHLGKIRGAVWCTTVAGSGCGPFILGALRDSMGSFAPGLWIFAVILLPLAPLMLLATPPIAKPMSSAAEC
ncbi:MAG: MFS transporter [Planctomycetota bacterium]